MVCVTGPAFRAQKFPISWPWGHKISSELQSLVVGFRKASSELQTLEFEFPKATSDTDSHVSSLQGFPRRTDTDI